MFSVIVDSTCVSGVSVVVQGAGTVPYTIFSVSSSCTPAAVFCCKVGQLSAVIGAKPSPGVKRLTVNVGKLKVLAKTNIRLCTFCQLHMHRLINTKNYWK